LRVKRFLNGRNRVRLDFFGITFGRSAGRFEHVESKGRA